MLRTALTTGLLVLPSAPLFAAQDAGPIVLREGDVLSNGWTVETILETGIADDGRWAALVDTSQPASGPSKAVVIDSAAVVLAEGQVLQGGLRVELSST